MSLSKQITKTPLFTSVNNTEQDITARTDVVLPPENSPIRFDILMHTNGSGSIVKTAGSAIENVPRKLFMKIR